MGRRGTLEDPGRRCIVGFVVNRLFEEAALNPGRV